MSSPGAESFYGHLFGTAPVESRLSIWCRQDKVTRHIAPDVEEFCKLTQSLSLSGLDVYVGIATRKPGLAKHQRGKVEECLSIGALWLDVDRFGPGHKAKNLPKDENDLLTILSVGPDPTLIVDSGGGWHVYWCFDHLRILDTATMSQRTRYWQSKYIEVAGKNGWHLDDTGNLDRVLRVPGTKNYK